MKEPISSMSLSQILYFVALTSCAGFLAYPFEMYKFDAINVMCHVYSCKHEKFVQGRRNV